MRILLCVISFLGMTGFSHGADWQWSTPMEKGRAFLWIPPNCARVRAVVVGQHNMIEQGILEHPSFRKTLGDLGIAEIWKAPPFDGVFHFDQGAGDKFNAMIKALSAKSGYNEIEFAPIIP
jgi:hypothetical protein